VEKGKNPRKKQRRKGGEGREKEKVKNRRKLVFLSFFLMLLKSGDEKGEEGEKS